MWNGRIAPLFDSSERFLLIEAEGSTDAAGECASFNGTSPAEKADCLHRYGVNTLLCGAISSDYQEALSDRGIETLSFLAGPLETVLSAWFQGTESLGGMHMPGCGCRRRRRRQGCRNTGRGDGININQGVKHV